MAGAFLLFQPRTPAFCGYCACPWMAPSQPRRAWTSPCCPPLREVPACRLGLASRSTSRLTGRTCWWPSRHLRRLRSGRSTDSRRVSTLDRRPLSVERDVPTRRCRPWQTETFFDRPPRRRSVSRRDGSRSLRCGPARGQRQAAAPLHRVGRTRQADQLILAPGRDLCDGTSTSIDLKDAARALQRLGTREQRCAIRRPVIRPALGQLQRQNPRQVLIESGVDSPVDVPERARPTCLGEGRFSISTISW